MIQSKGVTELMREQRVACASSDRTMLPPGPHLPRDVLAPPDTAISLSTRKTSMPAADRSAAIVFSAAPVSPEVFNGVSIVTGESSIKLTPILPQIAFLLRTGSPTWHRSATHRPDRCEEIPAVVQAFSELPDLRTAAVRRIGCDGGATVHFEVCPELVRFTVGLHIDQVRRDAPARCWTFQFVGNGSGAITGQRPIKRLRSVGAGKSINPNRIIAAGLLPCGKEIRDLCDPGRIEHVRADREEHVRKDVGGTRVRDVASKARRGLCGISNALDVGSIGSRRPDTIGVLLRLSAVESGHIRRFLADIAPASRSAQRPRDVRACFSSDAIRSFTVG